MRDRWRLPIVLYALLFVAIATAADLRFSDPARQSPPPLGAPGFPSRDPKLDVLPGFRNPPPGYGEIAFYWWLGDPLTKERISWQLEQLQGKGISGLQVNYAHSDRGGPSWGLTYPSDPPLFSSGWWDLFGWFLRSARGRGMAVSLSDYTLGPGQGWYFDEILHENPGIAGAALDQVTSPCTGACSMTLPAPPVSVVAYQVRNASMVPGSGVDLRGRLEGNHLEWRAPAGEWKIVAVYPKGNPLSIDPMNPLSGKKLVERFFQRFEDHNPGQSGKGLDFFFSDELNFGVRGWLWNGAFAAEFRKRKGYDIIPELPALFVDIGPRTPKIRLDYSDVMVSLEEENFFRPVYEWHRSRGMLYGCDHGGRGRDVTEFGDYFRTQRWMTGPGNDQPGLQSDVIKNKVSSSITHLYQRQRTWLEGYYGSGWGTTSAQLVDATWRNFVQGQNLLTLHGLYYSTHGGWWEWAPPCNHFRMPYWNHMGEFLHAVERMSYVLSQGVHRADAAILYPVAPVEAGAGGEASVAAAFDLGSHLYANGIDFDFIDFESLARANVEAKQLRVSGEAYRVLVLPSMKAVRYSTLEKALAFKRSGGLVIALGDLPESSDRAGAKDPQVDAIVRELFTDPASRATEPAEVERALDRAFPRDFTCSSKNAAGVLHRKVGSRDIYMVYGQEKGSECTFRTGGQVELWDPWTGATEPLAAVAQSGETTRLRMPRDQNEAQLIVFSPGRANIAAPEPGPPARIPISGEWEFELKPALDNRFGDYRLPVTDSFIGPEARRFRYRDESSESATWSNPQFDDSEWQLSTYSYGPRFWKLGPLPEGTDWKRLESQLTSLSSLDPSIAMEVAGARYAWQPYEFSMRWGIEGDPGHQGYHGLKEEMPDEFIALGRMELEMTTTKYVAEKQGSRYYLWTSVAAPRAMTARIEQGGLTPASRWINGVALTNSAASVPLSSGSNSVLLRYDSTGRGSFFLEDPESPSEWAQSYPLASRWYNRPGLLAFDTRPQSAHPAGWYRFTAPPGLRGMTVVARGLVQAWAGGLPLEVAHGQPREDGAWVYRVTLRAPAVPSIAVAIRVEQDRGAYAGAALPEPVMLDCGSGKTTTGDWSRIDGLSSYSGGAWYRRNLNLTEEQVKKEVWLDMGAVVSSAEVHVDGRLAGIRLAPPWKVNLARFVRAGDNRIEILVYNTLANHYQTTPTRYRGSPVSGLLGPVAIELR